MATYSETELTSDDIASYLSMRPPKSKVTGLEDILRARPVVQDIVSELQAEKAANRGQQPFVPEFTDRDYLRTRQSKVAFDPKATQTYTVTERPVYIEPTQDPEESYNSTYAIGALKIARRNIPPSGGTLEDQQRILVETLAVGDEEVAKAVAAKRRPYLENMMRATAEVTALAREAGQFSGDMGKRKKQELDAKVNEVTALKSQLELLDMQLQDDDNLNKYKSDRTRIAAQLTDTQKKLEDERNLAAAKARMQAEKQTTLDFAPAMEAVKQKKTVARAALKKEAVTLPREAQATLGELARLQEERAIVRADTLRPEEDKQLQLQNLNQLINEQRVKYAQQITGLPITVAERANALAIRQEKLIGYDEEGLDAQYAAKAKADETRMRLAQQLRAETFTDEQSKQNAEYDRRFSKMQEARGTAREKAAEIDYAKWEKQYLAKRIDKEADRVEFNAEWDRRQAALEKASDENSRETAQRSLDQLRERFGLGSQEWDRRYAILQRDKGTDREADAETRFNTWQKQELLRNARSDAERTALNTEWDRRQGVLDTTHDTNAREAAQRRLNALVVSSRLRQIALPVKNAAELDLYSKKLEASQRAQLTGTGAELHERDLADMRARIAEQAKLLPIKQQAAVDLYLRKLEDTKDLMIYRKDVDAAYADTPEDIQLKALSRTAGNMLAQEEQYNARVGAGELGDAKRKLIVEATGRSYGQLYGQDKEAAEAVLSAADYFVSTGTEINAINTIGMAPDRQMFAAAVLRNRQITSQGKGYMDTYTKQLAELRTDPDALKAIAPVPVNGKLPDTAPARWKQLVAQEAQATTAAMKENLEAQKQQYIASELVRQIGSVPVNNAINRYTLGFANAVYRSPEQADFIEGQIINSLSGRSTAERQAYADMLATLRSEAWTSYGDLVKKLTDAAQYENVGYGKLVDLPSANKEVLPKEQAAQLAGELLNRVLNQIDARTENTLSRSGYTPRTWEGNIKQAVRTVQALSWAEQLGLTGNIFKPVTPDELEQRVQQVRDVPLSYNSAPADPYADVLQAWAGAPATAQPIDAAARILAPGEVPNGMAQEIRGKLLPVLNSKLPEVEKKRQIDAILKQYEIDVGPSRSAYPAQSEVPQA